MSTFDNIYRTTSKRTIVLSFVVSLLLDFIPIAPPLAYWLPEFTAVMLIFWLLHRPENIGIGMAFAIGILSDIGSVSPLGQHALAFTVVAFIVQRQQRQILLYSFGLQSLAVLGALIMIQAIIVLVYFFTQHQFGGWGLFFSPFIGALLWPLLNNLMLTLANIGRRT